MGGTSSDASSDKHKSDYALQSLSNILRPGVLYVYFLHHESRIYVLVSTSPFGTTESIKCLMLIPVLSTAKLAFLSFMRQYLNSQTAEILAGSTTKTE